MDSLLISCLPDALAFHEIKYLCLHHFPLAKREQSCGAARDPHGLRSQQEGDSLLFPGSHVHQLPARTFTSLESIFLL